MQDTAGSGGRVVGIGRLAKDQATGGGSNGGTGADELLGASEISGQQDGLGNVDRQEACLGPRFGG